MTERQWYYAKDNQQAGPIGEAELIVLLQSGQIAPDSLVWSEGMPQWAAAQTIPGLGAPPAFTATPIAAVSRVTYAGFWKRVVASIIDNLVLGMAGGMAGFAIGLIYGLTLGTDAGVQWVAQFAGLVIGWLYHALMESSSQQASLGKMAMSIKVTDLDGRRLTFGRATGRHFGKIVSTLTLLIGYMMAGFTQKKQALHDMMAGCLVVNNG
ncbi:MAG TPA: RDD family protein [Kiritimatiellia bacterium]|nr:RDD family protein [Kiritimatiellia bacterium]